MRKKKPFTFHSFAVSTISVSLNTSTPQCAMLLNQTKHIVQYFSGCFVQ